MDDVLVASPADVSRADASLPTRWGDFRISVFRFDGTEVVALARGELDGAEPVLVRLHSECLTGDVLGSLRCDCGDQLRASLAMIGAADRGVLLYLDHEGRGIGLFDKVRAYGLQDGGLDTVDANVELGLPIDARDYSAAASVLQELGIRSVRLMTNNPAKILGLEMHGVDVLERVPLETIPNEINAPYLRAKASRMGHLLDDLPDPRRIEETTMPVGRPLVTVHYAQTIDATTSVASEKRAAAIRARGAEVLRVKADADGHVDLNALLARLRDEGIRSVLVEGGRGIITAVLREHLVDRLTVCIAPKVIGEGIAAVGDLHIDKLCDAMTFERSGFTASGGDVIFYGEPAVRA